MSPGVIAGLLAIIAALGWLMQKGCPEYKDSMAIKGVPVLNNNKNSK